MQAPAHERERSERTLRSVLREGASSSVMAAIGDTYFTAYALLFKATAPQVAFLAAAPVLLGSVAQLLSAWIGSRIGRHRTIILTGVGLQAASWLPIIWLPYLFPAHAVSVLIASIVLYYLGTNLATPLWNSLLGDVVPEDSRGRFFARRACLMNTATFLALSGAGFVMHLWEVHELARLGFLAVFSVAMVARVYSLYQVSRIDEPSPVRPEEKRVSRAELLHDLTGSNFARFSVFMALINFSAGIAGPFFAMYLLHDLHLSYLQFTAISAAFVLPQVFALPIWGRAADAFGNRPVLAVTAFIIPVLPALWVVSADFWFILSIQLVGGVAWAGFNLSAGNFIYDTVPRPKRPVYGAISNTLGNAGLFLGAMLGGYLATHLTAEVNMFGAHIHLTSSLYWIFLFSAVIRLGTAVSFVPLLTEERSVPRLSLPAFLVHLARFSGVPARVFSPLPPGRRRSG